MVYCGLEAGLWLDKRQDRLGGPQSRPGPLRNKSGVSRDIAFKDDDPAASNLLAHAGRDHGSEPVHAFVKWTHAVRVRT